MFKVCRKKEKELKVTYAIEYVECLPSNRSYSNIHQCANAGLSFGQCKFENKLINVRVLKNGEIVSSWRQ